MHFSTVMCCNTFVKGAYKQKCYHSVYSIFDFKFQHQHWYNCNWQNGRLFFNAACVLNKLSVLLILITESLLIYHG